MHDARSEQTLMAVLAPNAADLSAGSGSGPAVDRRVAGLPSLDDRIKMFARMVYGPDVQITPEIRALAREQILTAMAGDLVEATRSFTPAPQQLNRVAARAESVRHAKSAPSLPPRTEIVRPWQRWLWSAAAPFALRRVAMVALPVLALLVAGAVLTEHWRSGDEPADQAPAAKPTKMRGFGFESRPADTAAEQNLQREIAAEEAAHGRSDPAVARKLVDLAELLAVDRRYAEAQALCERALIIQDRALGPSDPETLRTIRELALIYRAEGHTKKADEILTRANQP